MQPQQLVSGVGQASGEAPINASSDQPDGGIAHLLPLGLHVQRNRFVLQQPVARLDSEGGGIERAARDKLPCRADGVDAGQKAADPLEHFGVVEFGRAATVARAHAEGEAAERMQRGPFQNQRTDGRDFGIHQLSCECVFLKNLFLAPSPRTIKLRHHRGMAVVRVLQVNLVHAVFVRAQPQQAAVAMQADTGQCIEHHVRCQRAVGMGDR